MYFLFTNYLIPFPSIIFLCVLNAALKKEQVTIFVKCSRWFCEFMFSSSVHMLLHFINKKRSSYFLDSVRKTSDCSLKWVIKINFYQFSKRLNKKNKMYISILQSEICAFEPFWNWRKLLQNNYRVNESIEFSSIQLIYLTVTEFYFYNFSLR